MSNAFNARINSLYKELAGRSVRFFVINANSNESIEEVRRHAVSVGYDFPVYKDVNEVVADLFGAVATPEAFVVDENGMVRYHGIVEDGANPERTTMRPLRSAVEALLQHKEVPVPETHGRGCAIRRSSDPH
jgi:alkyl hydroperoxide reductase subunit AhpC